MSRRYARTAFQERPGERRARQVKASFLTASVTAMLLWIALRPAHELPGDVKRATPLLVTLLPLPIPRPADPPPVRPPPSKPKSRVGGRRHRQSPDPLRPPALPPTALAHVEHLARMPLPVTTAFATADLATPSSLAGWDHDAGGQGVAIGLGDGAGTGTGSGPGSGSEAGDVLMKANWVTKPTDEAVRAFTPAKAAARHVSGEAIIACRVRLSTHVHDCRILAESARGFGFGSAAIAASRIFRVYPPRRNGKPLDDAQVAIPVVWISKAPPDAQAAAKKQANIAGPAPTDDPHRRGAADLPPS